MNEKNRKDDHQQELKAETDKKTRADVDENGIYILGDGTELKFDVRVLEEDDPLYNQ